MQGSIKKLQHLINYSEKRFDIIYGFRYGWGTDFFSYQSLYERGFTGNTKTIDNIEPLFRIINEVLQFFNTPLHFAFFTYSFFLIFGVFYILKDHRKIAFLALPIFYFMTAYQSSNLVRYCMAIGFIYIAITYLLKKRWLPFLFIFALAFLIHSSVIFFLPVLILFKYFDLFKKLWAILTLYFLSYFIFPETIGTYLATIIEISGGFFEGNSFIKFGSYFDSTKEYRYISGKNLLVSFEKMITIQIIFFTLIDLLVIYYGFSLKKLKNYENFGFYYNLAILGMVLYRPVYGFELPMRLNFFYWWFSFIVIAHILYFLYKSRRIYVLLALTTLLLLSFDFGPHTLVRVNKKPATYFWDNY